MHCPTGAPSARGPERVCHSVAATAVALVAGAASHRLRTGPFMFKTLQPIECRACNHFCTQKTRDTLPTHVATVDCMLKCATAFLMLLFACSVSALSADYVYSHITSPLSSLLLGWLASNALQTIPTFKLLQCCALFCNKTLHSRQQHHLPCPNQEHHLPLQLWMLNSFPPQLSASSSRVESCKLA